MQRLAAPEGQCDDPELKRGQWDRRPGESHKAFAAFTKYRDLAEKRTYQQVAEELHCNGSNVRRWARLWNWYARAHEWDVRRDQAAQEAQIRERRRMAERQARTGMEMQDLAAQGLRELLSRLDRKAPLNLSPRDIARLMEVGAKLERTARGEEAEDRPTTIEANFFKDEPPVDDPGEVSPR